MKRAILLLFAARLLAAQPQHWTYPLPPPETIDAHRGIEYRRSAGQLLKLDLYRPRSAARVPVVLFINGIGSPALREWPQYTGWGRLVTSRAMAGVAFDTREGEVPADLDALIEFLRAHAGQYALDMENVLVYACSANVQQAFPFLMSAARPFLKGAVLYYGYGDAPALRLDLPVFVARAAWDSPSLNRALDQLAARALAANAPWTIVNVAGHHGFEVVDDSPLTRDAIARTLDFLERASPPAHQQAVSSSLTAGRAAAALMASDWRAAAEAYALLAAERPEDAEAHRQLGEARLHSGDFTGALAELERAAALGSVNQGLIAYSAALCNVKLNRLDQAYAWLAKLPAVAGILQRLRADHDFDALRADSRFPAAAR